MDKRKSAAYFLRDLKKKIKADWVENKGRKRVADVGDCNRSVDVFANDRGKTTAVDVQW
jgi:hypothetical protein